MSEHVPSKDQSIGVLAGLRAEIEHLRGDNIRYENAHKILMRENERLRRAGGERYDDKRDLPSIIAHLRHGDADGQDHDDAADALERLERDNARLEELLRLAEGLSVPGRVQIIEFVHWNEDPLIPYEGCNCPACDDARTLVKTDVSDGTAKPPGDVPGNIAVGGPFGPPPVVLSNYCQVCGHPMYEHHGSPTPGGIVWCPQK